MNQGGPWTLDTWFYVLAVVIIVVVLSAFSATKRIAYWVGAIALLIVGLSAYKAGKL